MIAPTAGWENFFVAEVSAAAALSGLLFVAVSINLTRILAIGQLPDRAAETLLVLFAVLVVASCGLVPGQSALVLGAEIAAMGLLVWVTSLRLQRRAFSDPEARQWLLMRFLGTQASTLPFMIAGGLLMAGSPHGMMWLVPGTVASFASAVLNAWVLLIEIQR